MSFKRDSIAFKYFNSTVVRLKQFYEIDALKPVINFNSTVVRLKLSNPLTTSPPSPLFQFHCGSIKTYNRAEWEEVCYTHFNSTVVRLKQGDLYGDCLLTK